MVVGFGPRNNGGLAVMGIVFGFIDMGVTTMETSFAFDKLAVMTPFVNWDGMNPLGFAHCTDGILA